MYFKFVPLLIILNFSLFTQNMWQGNSVATSDNVDAMYLNPAGLGIDRTMSSIFLPYNAFTDTFSIQTANRYGNFGYTTEYLEGDNLFNPKDFNIGFGTSITKNLHTGFTWNKHNTITLGFLYRPLNFLSTGLTILGDDEFSEIQIGRFGFALRPIFGNHRFTIGSDVLYKKNSETDETEWEPSIIPFVEMQIIPGFTISLSSIGFESIENNWEFNNWSANIGISLGKGGLFSTADSDDNKNLTHGFGFYSSESVLPNIVDFAAQSKKDKPQTWVRMTMEGLFIEEPVRKIPFDFDLNIVPSLFGGGFDGPVHQLRAWVNKIDELTKNDEIEGLIIDWKYAAAGFAKRQEIYDAFTRFKDSGKKIIIYSTHGFSNNDYLLASVADEIYMHEDGFIDLKGFNVEMQFFRELLDTLDIIPEIIAISPYKSAGDAMTRKDMSPEVRENWGQMFGEIYAQFVNGISKGRDWDDTRTKAVIDQGPFFGQNIIVSQLITDFKYPDEFETYVVNINDENINILQWDEIVQVEEYQSAWIQEEKPKIAVIYAVGAISTGESVTGNAGSTIMGDETMREAIKTAREDQSVKAIVLRIDSPGGSGSASDLIWREIIQTTNDDTSNIKPFIASMSDIAASGGYYIACQADTIVAYPGTITGSIGVLGGRVNLSGLMNKIGINYDRITLGENADIWSGGKLWTNEETQFMRNLIVEFYGKFLNRVAAGREGLDSIKVDNVALGRVWTGEYAKELNLVDETGGLQKSIEIARAAAGIGTDQDIEIVEYPVHKPFDFFQKVFGTENTKFTFPEPFDQYSEFLELVELLNSDDILYLMPYKIEIE